MVTLAEECRCRLFGQIEVLGWKTCEGTELHTYSF